MGHVKTTIRSLTTWAQIPRLTLAVNSRFLWKFAILMKFNWQLSNYSIRWPSSPDRIAGSGLGLLSSRFFEVIRWQVTTFSLCLWVALLNFQFQTDLQPAFTDRENAFDLSHHGHALVTLYVQFLCSDWWKVDRWVHAENLCSILKLVYC